MTTLLSRQLVQKKIVEQVIVLLTMGIGDTAAVAVPAALKALLAQGRKVEKQLHPLDVGDLVGRHQPRRQRHVLVFWLQVRLHKVRVEVDCCLRQGLQATVEPGRLMPRIRKLPSASTMAKQAPGFVHLCTVYSTVCRGYHMQRPANDLHTRQLDHE